MTDDQLEKEINKRYEEYRDRLSHKDMRERMLSEVHDWDVDDLIDYVTGNLDKYYKHLNDRDMVEEFDNSLSGQELLDNVEHEVRCELASAMDEPAEVESASSAVCKCDLYQIMRGEGHDPGCPEV